MEKIRVLFEVVQEYYWPAMEPIYTAMSSDKRYELDVKIGPNHKRFMLFFLLNQKKNIEKRYFDMGYNLTDETNGFDVVICGDTLKKPELYGDALLCNVDHGPCFKTLRYRNLLKQPDVSYVVCAEGPYRIRKLKEYNLDKKEIVIDVGLPKLDNFFNGTYSRDDIIKRHNLDAEKKIVLYAPTYKPTSIFEIAKTIEELSNNFNVLVKLHPYSWSGKYAPHKQHRIFEKIAANNDAIVLVDKKYHDIMPYLFAADTMISEASSVINEFLILGRCGIIYDLPDESLKHSDGEPLLAEKTTEWLKDSFVHISDATQLLSAVKEAVNPSQERRVALIKDIEDMYSYRDSSCALRVKTELEKILEDKGKI